MQNLVKKFIEKKLNTSIVLEKPKDISFGHYATPVAFSLAKELKKSPMVIADELVLNLSDSDMFEKVEAVKGFINFKLSSSFLQSLVNTALNNKDEFANKRKKMKKSYWNMFLQILLVLYILVMQEEQLLVIL